MPVKAEQRPPIRLPVLRVPGAAAIARPQRLTPGGVTSSHAAAPSGQARDVSGPADCSGMLAEEVAVPAPEITFELLGGKETAAHADELQALHAEVYRDPPYGCDGDAAAFAARFRVQRRQPGFVLAEARHGGYLVGYACGMPLRPSTSWWRDLTTPLPDDVTTEHAGRTFALADLLVRAPWRRQGIARALHGLILTGRPEERATLTVLPAAAPAQRAFGSWGWRKVARARTGPGSQVCDVLLTALPASRS